MPPVRLREALLALLRGALWRSAAPAGIFPLTADEWGALWTLARQQTVLPLLLRGLDVLPPAEQPPLPLLMRWAAEADAAERRARAMGQAVDSLCAALRAEGVEPALLKGQATARHYAAPLLRTCGDADLYFPAPGAWHAATAAAERQGLSPRREPDGSLLYAWQGISVEHHPRLLDVHSPRSRRAARRLEQQWGFVWAQLPAVEAPVRVPAPPLELLLLSLHVLKHALGRGVGLRQLCDVACLCAARREELPADQLRAAAGRLGLSRWHALLGAVLTSSLGMPAEAWPWPVAPAARADRLLRIVWRGGNFGQFHPGRRPATSVLARKWATARAFAANVGFALSVAPREAFWSVATLLRGNI